MLYPFQENIADNIVRVPLSSDYTELVQEMDSTVASA